ncbi:MAG: hypothetical protein IPG82_18105 [Saprospiraceae bacterium]|nr:hypothetical protein [Saprospiraceae bacterium]
MAIVIRWTAGADTQPISLHWGMMCWCRLSGLWQKHRLPFGGRSVQGCRSYLGLGKEKNFPISPCSIAKPGHSVPELPLL